MSTGARDLRVREPERDQLEPPEIRAVEAELKEKARSGSETSVDDGVVEKISGVVKDRLVPVSFHALKQVRAVPVEYVRSLLDRELGESAHQRAGPLRGLAGGVAREDDDLRARAPGFGDGVRDPREFLGVQVWRKGVRDRFGAGFGSGGFGHADEGEPGGRIGGDAPDDGPPRLLQRFGRARMTDPGEIQPPDRVCEAFRAALERSRVGQGARVDPGGEEGVDRGALRMDRAIQVHDPGIRRAEAREEVSPGGLRRGGLAALGPVENHVSGQDEVNHFSRGLLYMLNARRLQFRSRMDGSHTRNELRARLMVGEDRLYRSVDERLLDFDSTEQVEPFEGPLGQPRALEAIETGAQFKVPGFNLYVAGAPGSGRESTVKDIITRLARRESTPGDIIYVHNFDDAERPLGIRLPPGLGRLLARDMDEFVRNAQREIPKAFDTENYERRRRETVFPIHQRRKRLLDALRSFADEHRVVVEITPAGFVSVPLHDGKPIPTEEFESLPGDTKKDIEKRTKEVQARASATLRELRAIDKEENEKVRELDREIARFAVGGLFDEYRDKYRVFGAVLEYLDRVQKDVLDHLDLFRTHAQPGSDEEPELLKLLGQRRAPRGDSFTQYRVNVLVDNTETHGAPVVFERNPTYYNLFGKISYRATLGAMVTDLLQIESGAVHRANGGFLVLDVLDLLRNPFSWEALKRVLLGGSLRMENLGEQFTPIPVATLRPEPVDVSVKVFLIGSSLIYHLLLQLDPEFQTLFKIKADFSPEMDWDQDAVRGYAAFLSRVVRDKGLLHFERGAVARVVEHGSRLREDQLKVTTRLMQIADLAAEASFWAEKAGRKLVSGDDVQTAIDKREFRNNLIEVRVREAIDRGTILIGTSGAVSGRINGIAVQDLGDHRFGRPNRITASIGLGRGAVKSIEREIKLSGPIHSKGVLILSGYLRGKYAQELPVMVGATITFEQSYDEVEGDSASSAELYVLLSAISELPIAQGIAATGSVNQQGEIQAVGGVNEKIEGFFAVCEAAGLTGEQGVIIPASNVPHLMLKRNVRDAVREGSFHVWQAASLDEGIELLFGLPAETVHGRVRERLSEFARSAQKFTAAGRGLGGEPPLRAA